MCNDCVQTVQLLTKTSKTEHNLYTDNVLKQRDPWKSTHYPPFLPSKHTLLFPLRIWQNQSVTEYFSTLYTGPITSTIK